MAGRRLRQAWSPGRPRSEATASPPPEGALVSHGRQADGADAPLCSHAAPSPVTRPRSACPVVGGSLGAPFSSSSVFLRSLFPTRTSVLNVRGRQGQLAFVDHPAVVAARPPSGFPGSLWTAPTRVCGHALLTAPPEVTAQHLGPAVGSSLTSDRLGGKLCRPCVGQGLPHTREALPSRGPATTRRRVGQASAESRWPPHCRRASQRTVAGGGRAPVMSRHVC